MKRKYIKVESIFPIWLHRSKNGEVFLKDIQDDCYTVFNTDKSLLTESQYQGLLEDKTHLGFWGVVSRFWLKNSKGLWANGERQGEIDGYIKK